MTATIRPRRPSVDRWAPFVEGWFRLQSLAVYVFLFLPIVVGGCGSCSTR